MSIKLDHLDSLVLIAGMSGAGKSTALHKMSDLGFYVIENLPIPLLRAFIDFSLSRPNKYALTSLILDTDSSSKARELLTLLDEMEGSRVKIVFLDCDTEVLLKRYSETRRPHPNFNPGRDSSLEDTIQRERERLEQIKYRAHLTIDTSALSQHDLRRELALFVEGLGVNSSNSLRVNFVSFGFKYGLPRDCDLIVDIRFLPNPYFVPALRPKVGLDADVAAHVLESTEAKEFLEKYVELLRFLLPHYAFEGKAYLNIGVGCTGGKHRSVAVTEELKRRVTAPGVVINVRHRDINRR